MKQLVMKVVEACRFTASWFVFGAFLQGILTAREAASNVYSLVGLHNGGYYMSGQYDKMKSVPWKMVFTSLPEMHMLYWLAAAVVVMQCITPSSSNADGKKSRFDLGFFHYLVAISIIYAPIISYFESPGNSAFVLCFTVPIVLAIAGSHGGVNTARDIPFWALRVYTALIMITMSSELVRLLGESFSRGVAVLWPFLKESSRYLISPELVLTRTALLFSEYFNLIVPVWSVLVVKIFDIHDAIAHTIGVGYILSESAALAMVSRALWAIGTTLIGCAVLHYIWRGYLAICAAVHRRMCGTTIVDAQKNL